MIGGATPVYVRTGRGAVRLALVLVALAGCTSRPSTVQTASVTVQADPFDELTRSVRDELRQTADQAVCRRLVDQLNGSIPRLSADRKPAGLTAAERAMLEGEFTLRPTEVAEVGRAEFTLIDAYYLEETFLFRDVARALDVDKLPPVQRAEAALGWVVRNLRGVEPTAPAVPPRFAAMRGSATPVERTYALFELLRQLDVDAALVGDPRAGTDGIWAVGVLADGQVYLFDVRLGLPLPGPDGRGVLTLARARSAAEPFKPLALDDKLPYEVTAERAKRAEVFVTAPMSSLSPRMRFFQGLLTEGTARVAGEPAATRDRIRQALTGPDAPAVRFWCPPVPDALPRVLFTFLPAAEGGDDRNPEGPRRVEQYLAGQLPFDLLPPFLRELQGQPGHRVRNEFINRVMVLTQPGHARDLILRGRFRDATDKLVAVQEWTKRRTGSPQEMEKTTRAWADAARAYFAEASRQERGHGDLAGAGRLDELRTHMEALRRDVRGPDVYLDYLVGDELGAQATYLLGLCKHEEAERLMHRREAAAAAKPAWASARRWWTSFLEKYPNRVEAAAAKRNLARAFAAEGRGAEAKAVYDSLAATGPTPPERLASRYLAEQLK